MQKKSRQKLQLYRTTPGETVRFEFELPSGVFNSEQVDIESEIMELNGYIKK